MEKVTFIYCSNDELLLTESINYINCLNVPDGVEVDFIVKKGAKSMAEGYNQAMKGSSSEIKVYLHQDVFILNKNFIKDIMDIFSSDLSIGMIGMVGYERVSSDGIMWHAGQLLGETFERSSKLFNLSTYSYSVENDGYRYVAQIDGLLMATRADVEWNEEYIKGFDFYDAIHSIEMLRAGYKIVVPNSSCPWVLHDDNKPINMENYERARQVFIENYDEYLGEFWSSIWNDQGFKEIVCQYFETKNYNKAINYLWKIMGIKQILPTFWILYASLYEMLGEEITYYECIKKGLAIDPDNYELLYMLGNYWREKDCEKAINFYKKAIDNVSEVLFDTKELYISERETIINALAQIGGEPNV